MTGKNAQIPRLEVRGIRKSFGAVEALRGVDFEVRPGEVMALVGDNGAGKSTLVKVLSGSHSADEGEVLFGDKPVAIKSPNDASALGIQTVYQDLSLCDNLDVVENMFLGNEDGGGLRSPLGMRELAMEKRAVEVLKSLQVHTLKNPRLKVAVLSGGQRQSVAIARATMWDSSVILLDEPTAALGVAQTAQVLELIANLRAKGLSVVLISHNLGDVYQVADRISVLRLGKRVALMDVKETTHQQVVEAITGGQTTEGVA